MYDQLEADVHRWILNRLLGAEKHPYKMKCARLLLWQGASHHKGLFFSDAKLAVIPASHNSKVLFIAERRKEWREKADNRKSVRH